MDLAALADTVNAIAKRSLLPLQLSCPLVVDAALLGEVQGIIDEHAEQARGRIVGGGTFVHDHHDAFEAESCSRCVVGRLVHRVVAESAAAQRHHNTPRVFRVPSAISDCGATLFDQIGASSAAHTARHAAYLRGLAEVEQG